MPTGDGISEMKLDPQRDADSWRAFKDCMDKITNVIPGQKHNSTPIFLGATAGMRLLQWELENWVIASVYYPNFTILIDILWNIFIDFLARLILFLGLLIHSQIHIFDVMTLIHFMSSFCFALSEKDPQRSSKILASLREYLSSLPFSFQNASIITGEEEGLYGWITVNYLMGNFLEAGRSHSFTFTCTCYVKYETNTFSINVCRRTFGTPTYAQQGPGQWVPWTLAEHQHRSPLQSRMILRELTTCVSNCTATLTMYTHTVSSATVRMRLRRWLWTKWSRYAAFSFCIYEQSKIQ